MRKTRKKKIASAPVPLLDPRKSEELLGFLLILFAILLAIALFTFQPDEKPGGERISVDTVRNQLGIAGVYLSYYLIHTTIGYSVIVLPFILIAWGVLWLLGRETALLRRWTFFVFLLAFLTAMGLALYHYAAHTTAARVYEFSGFLGVLGATVLRKLLGFYGAVILLIGIFSLCIILFTSFSFREILDGFSGGLARLRLGLERSFRNMRSGHKAAETTFKRLSETRREEPVVSRTRMVDEEVAITEAPPRPQPGIRPVPAGQLDMELPLEEEEDFSPDVAQPIKPTGPYVFPPLTLLQTPEKAAEPLSEAELRANAHLLESKLADFDIEAKVTEIHPGPVITRYEMELAPGIKVSRIAGLADDLAMVMRAKRIRIVAPIPGKNAVGVEIPNPSPSIVYLREILASQEFQQSKSTLSIGLGKTISGAPYIGDLTNMPHLLVAGSTGSGKSVCLNTIIASFLYKAHPAQVQFVLIDPKRLELSTYAQLHNYHLSHVEGVREKVATSAKSAIAVLKSVEQEMERRYDVLATAGVRNIEEYNQRVVEGRLPEGATGPAQSLHYLVVIVDELADLMLTSSAAKDVEEPIARLTQMSRAVGIHLIVATQRPSVDVITGVIKANFPARMAFQVATKVDSRTILDMNGAEKLLGRGDMLFLPPGSPEAIRIHNAYISLEEIEGVIAHIKTQPVLQKTALPAYIDEEAGSGGERIGNGKRDALFDEAMRIVVRTGQGSVSILQRRLKVGYSRAARLVDELEDAGVVGPFEGSKAREVLMTPEELEAMYQGNEEDDEDV